MVRPSPAPRRPSRIWIWVASIVLAVLGAALTAVLTAPQWGVSWVRDRLQARLQARLELPVEIDALTLSWDRVHLQGLRVGVEGEGPFIHLDEVDVEIETDLWPVGARALTAVIRGGRIEGERTELEALARRVSSRPARDEDGEAGRIRPVPASVEVSDLALVVTETLPEAARSRRIETRLEARASLADKRFRLGLADLRADLGRGPVVTARRIATDLQAEKEAGQWSVVFPLQLEIEGLGAPVTDQIAVSSVTGRVVLMDAAVSEIELDLGGSFSDQAVDEGGRLWSITGKVARDLSAGNVVLNMEAFELGKIPEVLERLPLRDSEHGTVGGHLAVDFGDGIASVRADVEVRAINVDHPLLARETVRDLGFAVDLVARIDPGAKTVELERAAVHRKGVSLELSGTIVHPPRRDERRYHLQARVPAVPCQAVLDAMPVELTPSLQGFVLEGEFEAAIAANIDFADLDSLSLEGDVGIGNCKIVRVPPHAAVDRLASGFTHRVAMRDGSQRTVQMFPGSNTFTSLAAISPHMVQAVLTTEDGGFWRHRGFLPSQFEVALRRNLAAGKIQLGASTITMQMVKNVLLSHERTLARKLQELFLTWYVETTLTKNRIMELYLNAIEFGPGIYGVTRAAAHYFGKHPSELTPPEAVFLAVMLPSPVRRHLSYCRGELTKSMAVKVQRILRIMNERKRLSDLDYEIWRDVPIEFDLRERGSEAECTAQIRHLMQSRHTQRALSGLLGDSPDIVDDLPPPSLPGIGDLGERADPALDDDASTGEDPFGADADMVGRPAMDDDIEQGDAW